MNKKLIAIGLTLGFLMVGFSGCNELIDTDENNEVEILEYNVKTHWRIRVKENIVYRDKLYNKSGFYHEYPQDIEYNLGREYLYYEISGEIKNVAGRKLDSIKIGIICYDAVGNILYDSSESYTGCFDLPMISNLPNGYEKAFSIKIYKQFITTLEYFEEIDDFDFVIKVN